jgi:carbon-nitrogen hydrolase
MAYVVAANQAASRQHYPPFSWPGGSMIVDFDGRILSQADAGPVEKVVVGPIDLAALRDARERRRGHHLLAHLRNEAYPAYARPLYPAGTASERPPDADSIRRAHSHAMQALARLTARKPGDEK